MEPTDDRREEGEAPDAAPPGDTSLGGHAPGTSGFWLHPVKGTFPLDSREHHRDLFLSRPDLFGTDLPSAYEEGWVSIRKRVGEGWRIVCENPDESRPLLAAWATRLLGEKPEEAEALVTLTSMVDGMGPIRLRLRELAAERKGEEGARD